MKATTRILSMILCLVMLAGTVLATVGCGETGDVTDPVTTTAAPDVSTTAAPATETTAPPAEPAKEDFSTNGNPTPFTIMVRKNRYGYLYDDGSSPERVNSTAFARNLKIEERYGIEIAIVEQEETADAWNAALLASTGEYDLACFDYWWGIEQNGLLYDLAALPELDLDDPHWYSGWNDNCTINGKLFSIAGDATLEVLENIEIIFFNKKMAEANSLDLYGMVRDGSWTMEKMEEIGTQVSRDLNNDTTLDDVWGSLFDVHSACALLYSSGMRLTDFAADGTISLTNNTDALVRIGELCGKLLNADGVRYDSNTARSSKNFNPGIFTDGQSLFLATALYLGKTLRAANSDVEYGVIVPPKADVNSEYYTTTYGASLFGIPLSVKDVHKSAVILDALNYYSKDTVVDAFYEVVLKGQIADSQDDADMMEQARQTVVVDFAFINSLDLNTMIRDAAIAGNPLGSVITVGSKLSKTKLDKIIKAYE